MLYWKESIEAGLVYMFASKCCCSLFSVFSVKLAPKIFSIYIFYHIFTQKPYQLPIWAYSKGGGAYSKGGLISKFSIFFKGRHKNDIIFLTNLTKN